MRSFIAKIRITWIVSFIAIVASVHIIANLNKGFFYNGSHYSPEQYRYLVDKAYAPLRYRIVTGTSVYYFGEFTGQLLNVFYGCYLLAVLLFLIWLNFKYQNIDEEYEIQKLKRFLAEMKLTQLQRIKNKSEATERPTKLDNETMAAFARRLIDWEKEHKK